MRQISMPGTFPAPAKAASANEDMLLRRVRTTTAENANKIFSAPAHIIRYPLVIISVAATELALSHSGSVGHTFVRKEKAERVK